MKTSQRTEYALAISALAILAGCLSLYDNPGDTDAGTTTPGNAATTNPDTSGFFPPGSHDVTGQTLFSAGASDPDAGAETESFFRAIQLDPASEDSAGPKFLVAGDIDNDGMVDIASAWNQSQPIQIHLQRRVTNDNGDEVTSFTAVSIAGTTPVASMAGLELADLDRDGWLDIVALVKNTSFQTFCIDLTGKTEPIATNSEEGEIILYFNPADADGLMDGDQWEQVELGRSLFNGRNDVEQTVSEVRPEFNGYSALDVGDIDGINGPDIVVAFNPEVCEFTDEDPPTNRIDIYANPGNDFARDPGNPPLTVVAIAGSDQNIGIPEEPTGVPPLVVLDGSDSYAADGNGVWYQWEQIFGPPVSLDFATTANPEFFGPTTPAIIQFQLTVSAFSDATVQDFDIVTVYFGDTTNLPPFANAGPDQVVIPARLEPGGEGFENPENVVLDGAASIDPQLEVGVFGNLTYLWIQTYGEAVALIGEDTATPLFTAPDTPQTLRFRLIVTDEAGLMATDLVEVLVRQWAPVLIAGDAPVVRDVLLSDIEDDGDLDIVFTYPNALSANVSWSRNPRTPLDDDSGLPGRDLVLDGFMAWERRPIGQVDTEADVLAEGDVDGDGFEDIMVRSTQGGIVQWFRRPTAEDVEPIFPPPDPAPDRFNFPWQVYSLFEFNNAEPVAIGIGDLTGDGIAEAVIGAGSGVSWYAPPLVTTSEGGQEIRPQDLWTANVIVRDFSGSGGVDGLAVVNEVLVVDLDGDGRVDFLGGEDRQEGSGLSSDSIIWYRNVIGDEEAE